MAASRNHLEVVTEPLGGSALSLAAQGGHGPERWYKPRPANPSQWRSHAVRVAQSFAGRDWLRPLEPALSAAGAAADRLARAAAHDGVVVTTGQQPGLFGGPVYTFSKALTALALADELEAAIGRPVAPVFWAATDDADFEEARSTTVALGATAVRLSLRHAPRAGTPMSEAPTGDVTAELRELERACGSRAFESALDAVRTAYAAGATVGGAYVELLRTLLAPLGIAVLDAAHPAVRRQGAGVLRRALTRARETAQGLAARATELRANGFEPQVQDVAELSLVFVAGSGGKRRVRIDEASGVALRTDPEALSANVLLRPVLERAILPTVAYAAGPAELSYFAQVSAVSDALEADTPLPVPRWSATIIEPHVYRILERLGARYTDLRDPHALEGHLARAALPGGVTETIAKLRDAISEAAAALAADGEATELLPAAPVAGARASLLDRVRRLERRYVAAVKRREDELMRLAGTARAHLYPHGERQERVLNFIPMLARHGPWLLEAMRHAARTHARALVGSGSPAAAGSAEDEPAERGAAP